MARDKKLEEKAKEKVKSKFSLEGFRQKKGLTSSTAKYKDLEWIPFSEPVKDIVGLPGVPSGHITLLRGHSDSGKTSLLIELATAAQTMGKLPVLIITEMKWSWEHARDMGFKYEEVVDTDSGEVVDYQGHFLYVDRGTLNTIEDVAEFINDLLDEQSKGNLPFDLVFFWDSVGSIPCDLSIRSSKSNAEWNAGALSTQFGNNINQKILLSRKESSPHTNTLIAVNKVWTMKPEVPMGSPKLMNKGGMALWYDASLVITFGNITNSGTSKIKAVKDGKQVEFAKRGNIQVEKNHISGIQSRGRIIATPHGFIADDKKAIDQYKNEHKDKWLAFLGTDKFDLVEEGDLEEDFREYSEED